jgi:predicted amidohydrolase
MSAEGNPFTVACVQNRAERGDRGLDEALGLIDQAAAAGARLVCLPEFCHSLHIDRDIFETGAAPEPEHPAIEPLAAAARRHGIWLLAGSVAVSDGGERCRNRSLLFDPGGGVAARYDKIHMFDVTLGNGESYRESARFAPGESATLVHTPLATIGMTICYDLRFAALYRALAQRGAELLTVPAAFTHTTGQAHWHVLLRSRAIETGCYVVAPCQYGYHGKARTYGHSLIIDPWGGILAEGPEDDAAVITAEIDLSLVADARSRIPALEHDRVFGVQELTAPK